MRVPIKSLRVACIVTVLLTFLQPPLSGRQLYPLPQGSRAVQTAPVVPEGILGPTFYEDLLFRWGGDTAVLLVLADYGAEEFSREIIRRTDESSLPGVALLLPAPRHDPGDAGRLAALIREVPTAVPRIFLSTGTRTEWTVSVPGEVAPLWLVRTIRALPDARLNEAQLNAARLGYGLWNAALEAALVEDAAAAHLTLGDPGDLDLLMTNLLAALAETRDRPRDYSRNYLLLPGRTVIISEFRIVQGIILLAAILLLYSVVLPRRVLHYLRSMARNIPAIIITLLIIVASLMAANIALRLVGRITRISPDPLLLAGGKIAFGSLVMSVLAALLGHRIRHATAVYSGTAVLFLLAGAILSGAVSVILGAYFSVSFVFGVLFSIGRNAWIKGIALVLSMVPLLYLVLALAPAADRYLAAALLTPPLTREIVTAVILLPMLLMFFRLDSIAAGVPLLPVFAMVATIGLALTTATLIAQVQNPEPLELLLRDDFPSDTATLPERRPERGERTVLSAGGAIQEEIAIHIPGEELFMCPALPCIREIPAPTPPFSLRIDRTRLLDRHTISWRVNYHEQADTVLLVLESDQPVQLYATDMPTEQPEGSRGTRFVFRTGPRPPEEFSGAVVLRSETGPGRVTLRATSRFPGFAATPAREFTTTHLGRTWTIRETVTLE